MRPFRVFSPLAGLSMIGFSPSTTQTANRAAFRDADGAQAWLAAQPQADAAAMSSALIAQIEALNLLDLSPRERFKTLDVLRKAVFAAGTGGQPRYEGKPLPLDADEQAALDAALRLWRAYAVGYRQCLQACLDGDASLSRYVTRVAHRVSSCLRLEQLTGYAGGAAPRPGFWESFHTLFLAAEQIGCAAEMVEDRLSGETQASSVCGQYAMALMLHLAQPFSLSSGQLAVAARWLARWREQARIDGLAVRNAKYSPILLDLAVDRPIHDGGGPARLPRWLSLGSVQRKIRQRLDALAAGESPESLKLGGGLSAENCMALLETLSSNLRRPAPFLPAAADGLPGLAVGVGLSAIHRLLGGKGIEEVVLHSDFSTDDPPVRREAKPHSEAERERWRLARWEGKELALLRAPGKGSSRLALHGLLAIARQKQDYLLAVISGLWQNEDGILFCTADLLPGGVTPRIAEIRNWMTGEVVCHPAFQLSAQADGAQDMLLLPTGVLARASGVRFFDCDGQLLFETRLADCLERGDEVEFWRVASND
ncbi:MAG: hypothetical protein LBS49_14635 [Candidatus Accumulibacter sp.]|jgi:hypothetical protein|nr:hypothetical protein [Accumulibacter sp.]